MYFSVRHGRLHVCLRVLRQGRDWVALLCGGEAHVGAVALGSPYSPGFDVLTVPGHKEDALAQETAARLSAAVGCHVCVVAGIHNDNITAEEIQQVQDMVRDVTEQCLAALRGGRAC